MKNRILKFNVSNQHISSDDICVVADSRNYLMALFEFDPTWESVIKTAVFSHGNDVYNMLLTDDMCRVPAEVVCGDGFFVSVFGGDLITADKVKVSVTPSGMVEGVAPPEPTPSVYDQMLTLVAAEVALAEGSADEAEQHAITAESFAAAAKADKEALLTGGTRWVFDGGGATGNAHLTLVVDDEISDISTNPVQNKVVKEFVEKKAAAAVLENLNEIAADYVIETSEYNPDIYIYQTNSEGIKELVKSGPSTAVWEYKKWKSGLIEIEGGLWLDFSDGLEDVGGIYSINKVTSMYGYPCPLTGAPHITLGVGYVGNHGFCWVATNQYQTHMKTCTPQYRVLTTNKTVNDPSEGVHICLHIVGRWK